MGGGEEGVIFALTRAFMDVYPSPREGNPGDLLLAVSSQGRESLLRVSQAWRSLGTSTIIPTRSYVG
jgi:hypothetical protein